MLLEACLSLCLAQTPSKPVAKPQPPAAAKPPAPKVDAKKAPEKKPVAPAPAKPDAKPKTPEAKKAEAKKEAPKATPAATAPKPAPQQTTGPVRRFLRRMIGR